MLPVNIKLFLRRALPFFLFFILLQISLRAALLIRETGQISTRLLDYLHVFTYGFLYDMAVFSYLLIPIAFLYLIIPKRYQGSRFDHAASALLYFVFVFLLFFDAVGEWLFWDEFSTRFNFIAVDYLVYTHEVIDNIKESYHISLLISAIALIALLCTWIYQRRHKHASLHYSLSPRHVFNRAAVLVACISVALLSWLFAPGYNREITRNAYMSEAAKNGIFTLFSAFWNNQLSYADFYPQLSPQEATDRTARLLARKEASPASTDLTYKINPAGKEKRYNVIVTVMESMSGDYMATFGNTQNLTPNLDALAKNSLFFTRLYANGTRTVRGLEAIALSLPPSPGNSLIRQPGNEELSSIGYVFRDRGYDTKFIYGGYGYFDNMNYFFNHNGFNIVDRGDMEKDEIHFANAWGVADEDLFARVIREADTSQNAGKPFMHVIMTTSNHRPFTYPDGRIDQKSGSGRLGGVKYADYAVGKFLEDARKHRWFNDTIFVFVADHTAGSAGKTALDPDKYHIPAIIYAPAIVPTKQITRMTSQIDVMPTVLGLLNFHYPTKSYGKDALKNPVGRAFVANYEYLGYMTEKGGLSVLKPKNNLRRTEGEISAMPEQQKDAVALYQTASKWRETMRRINTLF